MNVNLFPLENVHAALSPCRYPATEEQEPIRRQPVVEPAKSTGKPRDPAPFSAAHNADA